MTFSTDDILGLMHDEFVTGSYNAPALLETLASIDAETAFSEATWEGYSPAGIALHVMYYKFLLARSLSPLFTETFRYAEGNFPPVPGGSPKDVWKQILDDLLHYDTAYAGSLRSFPESRLEETMPEFGCSYRKAILWMITHDTYHNAQVRSMGVSGLRKMKDEA